MEKNKDIYTLTDLDFDIHYQVDGCGKRIPKPFYVDILYHGEVLVKGMYVRSNMTKVVLEWLESPPI